MLLIIGQIFSLLNSILWILLPLSSLFWILSPEQATSQLKAVKLIQILAPFICVVSIFGSLLSVLFYGEMQNHYWTVWNVFPFFGVGVTSILMVALNLYPSSMLILGGLAIPGIIDSNVKSQELKGGNKTIRLARAFSLTTGVCILISFGQFLILPIISLFFK